ncbi:tRNA pseudouridine(38-40) synthase TruA [Anaeromyxobacter paludicola]|uniref:tRNA pseudouridine synthase A n=1 Tax=Anaeromyxobacter paludicola TaxID=2918171 RepID=A0ABM7X7J6_9BACT|nr:tRNA pseudouridine(38-40) synthase TruA [Anaeromyxobacter paludicola]BDG07808.1 tRNA pseudouridine synthase A [Anaeromyxobacter paludicola]
MQNRRYALRIAYDGAAFRGFQRQPGLPTVQGALEDALAQTGLRARLDMAARTDAGVHALAQVVTFTARSRLAPAELRAALNARTPPGLLCLDAVEVAPSFHARASAVSRTYVYLVGLPPPEPLRPYAWSLPDPRSFPEARGPLDVAAMRAALSQAVGEHDFAGFARPGEQTAKLAVDPEATVRTLLRAEVHEAGFGPLYAIVLEGQGFLRAMVRHLVGTAVAVGVGAARPDVVGELLRARERYRGVRAPGWGLTLARVTYPAEIF